MTPTKDKLEKLQIRGFGANKKLDIDFSPQVTTIIGKSFIGKSWILRALKWVARNKPSGDSFINWNSIKATVKLFIKNKKVTRIRSKKTNVYKLSDKKKPLIAGNNVPDDIEKLLNLSDINFQTQHESPFWFCETAGEVSRQLNSIVNLELIDSTLANIESKKRKTNTIIEITKKDLADAKQQRKDLSYVENLNRDLEHIERLQKRYEEKSRTHATIDEKLKICINLRKFIKNTAEQVSDGLKLTSMGDDYLKTTDLVKRLSELIETTQKTKNVLRNKPPSLTTLNKLKKQIQQTDEQYDRLNTIIISIRDLRKEKCQMEKILESNRKKLDEIAGNRCPLCGKIKEKCLKCGGSSTTA
jgi:hypothetical protein